MVVGTGGGSSQLPGLFAADCCLVTGDLPLLGFGLPVSGRWATPDTIRRIARRAEALGYASLWTFQRVLYPADGGLGEAHRSVLDPVLPLAHVAGHTDRIRLGTATVSRRSQLPRCAKTLTSLDVLSGGRLTAGLGMGWLPQEYAAAGVPYERRGERMDEYLRCLEALWTQDPVEFAGEFYTVPRSHLAPPPVQRPAPGAAGRRRCAGTAPRRTARPGLDLQQPAGPHEPRRVDRGGARWRAGGRARP